MFSSSRSDRGNICPVYLPLSLKPQTELTLASGFTVLLFMNIPTLGPLTADRIGRPPRSRGKAAWIANRGVLSPSRKGRSPRPVGSKAEARISDSAFWLAYFAWSIKDKRSRMPCGRLHDEGDANISRGIVFS